MNNFSDFHTVKDLKFDVQKLQKALNEVLSIKNYDSASGIKNFAAICLNQIPGKPESTTGNYARGVYWTKPNHSGKEAVRDKILDETNPSKIKKYGFVMQVVEEVCFSIYMGNV